SLSDPASMVAHSGVLLGPVGGVTFSSYEMVLSNSGIGTGYRNTLFLVIVGTAINVVMTSFGAYVLSRRGYMGKRFLNFFVVFTMFFGGGLIPFYLTVKSVGLLDSLWALILPKCIATYNMIIMRTAFQGVPDSIEESAHLDGANDFTILFRMFWPLTLPTMAVMILFYAVDHWNAWFNAMIFIQTRALFPLQLILREILISSDTSQMTTGVGGLETGIVGETIKYSTIIVATVPVLVVYPFLQRYFVQGIMIGAVKG
ncbi:MAG: carbohydrate ABC transporter permease, partial [Candidatus Fimadaptatus sp.]